MDEDRYAELALDSTRWVRVARRLRLAAEELGKVERQETWGYLAHVDPAHAIGSWERFVAAGSGCGILLAYAVENACKARVIRLGRATVEDKKLKGLPSGHDLVNMVRQVGVTVAGETELTLRRLTWQVLFIGRYPIAKSLKQQETFGGTVEGHSATSTVDRVILEVLHDPDLVALYTHPDADTVRSIGGRARGPAVVRELQEEIGRNRVVPPREEE